MTTPLHLVAIVGSLRAESFNRFVFNAAKELMPANAELTEALVKDVPLYNGDVESTGDPAAIVQLKQKVDAADGLVVFTPEYNRSVPAVTKNAIDWLSRVPGDSVLSRTTVGIVAATPGRHDASGVRTHLSSAVSANTQHLYGETLGISSIGSKLTDGQLTDEETRQQLAEWLGRFMSYIAEQRPDQAAKNQDD